MSFQNSQTNSRITQQQKYSQYQYDQNEDLQVIVQQKQPQQKIISLTNVQLTNPTHEQFRNQKDDIEQKQKLVLKLKAVLNSKIEQVKQAKKNVMNCKKQIRDIGEEVDKQMNKSLMKHSKPHTYINIKEIFQTTKSSNPQINKLTQQLQKVRAEAKKVKSELKTIQTQVKSPINLINAEKATQIRAKIKQAQVQLKTLKQQKQYLQQEVRIIQFQQQGNQVYNDEQIKANKQKSIQLSNQIKEQKSKMYDLQKQDRILTEKIRYVIQLQQQVQIKKNNKSLSNSILTKQQLQASMRKIIQEINQLLEKRNKVEAERKNLHKTLETDVAAVEAKNWEIINKLRQIDAKLIKHYNTKLKKTKGKKQNTNEVTTVEDQSQKQRQKPIQTISNTIKTIYSSKNDKNYQPNQADPPIFIQKRKNYEFFMNPSENQPLGNITLNDQMLGNKLTIKRLSFQIDENCLYGINADYENQQKFQVKGYKIMSRIKPKDILTKTLIIDQSKNQVINYIHVGIGKSQSIKYLHIITSQAKQFKWGSLQNCEKNQQKNIRKYESITIKGKLNQIGDKEAPNYYNLAGIGFTIVYLGPK